MPIERVFLGHDRPALVAAAEYLLSRYAQGTTADLRQVNVVVPGSRAGRRLIEVLVNLAAERSLMLTPPLVDTVGKLPERLYRPKRPFATDLTQRLVWSETLQQSPSESLIAVVPAPPAHGDVTRWLALGDLLRRQHAELAADGLNFQDVARLGVAVDGFREQARWKALQQIQEDYLRRLDALELWDLQTARLKAIEFRECQTDVDIVLVGTVDLNLTVRKMLDQIGSRVTALIFAPSNWNARFDAYGCLATAAWQNIDLPIVAEQVEVADGPADQASAVARRIHSFAGRYRADEIVIGLPDEKLVPDIERQLAMRGVTARWGPGESFAETGPIRLLTAVATYLEDQQYRAFAALVRHPDVEQWLLRSNIATDWLERLDEFQNQQLPFRLSMTDASSQEGSSNWCDVASALQRLLGDLPQPPRLLSEWSGPIWRVVTELYGHRPLHLASAGDVSTLEVCNAVRAALLGLARVPSVMMPKVPANSAIRYILDELRNSYVPATAAADAVEMLGWLELPLDDAPALIVTNFNEGFVPESLNSDLFLPDNLRRRLGILDNARRYARDAYAVSVLAATRESLQWIVGRRNHEGDPVAPSRLLFACDSETTAKRALQFFRSPTERAATSLTVPSSVHRRLDIPRPRALQKAIDQLNVTAFRDYLACPYRFYLKHVLRLETINDEVDELDGAAFGNLAHEVLRRFGTSANRELSDPVLLREALDAELDRIVAEGFGEEPLPAVLVQVEQLRWRLRAFADQQAAWYSQGWRIEFIESPAPWEGVAALEVDGKPMRLNGRLDRIDKHVTTGERVILDYKTSDTGRSPEATHRSRGEWIDLQLPLYRHLAAALGIAGPVRMGYILLPKDTAAVGFEIAKWSVDELVAADEIAKEVIRRIRREEFWPPADPPPAFADDFAPICQDGVVR